MAKHNLKAITALGETAPIIITIGGFRITERFDVSLASLASRMSRAKEVAKLAKSAKIPLAAPSSLEAGKTFNSFWLAAEQWMVEADFAHHEDIATELKSLFGDAASITEQTDAWVRFDIASKSLLPLCERLCNVDFATAPIGFASRTLIEHIGCYLIKRSAVEVTIYGPRSSAHSLWHALEVTAHSV